MCELTDIVRYCKPSSAGFNKVVIFRLEDVQTIPKVKCNVVVDDDIELISESRPYIIQADKQSIAYVEEQVFDKAGDYWNQNLNLNVKVVRPSVVTMAKKLQNKRVHVLFGDRNKQYRLLYNARLKARNENGPRHSGPNGFSFSFTKQSIDPAPFYGGALFESEIIIDNNDLILIPPSGQRYRLEVDNCGALITTLIP
jgi:hypothetical protein